MDLTGLRFYLLLLPRWVPERLDGEGWLLLLHNGISLLVMGKQGSKEST